MTSEPVRYEGLCKTPGCPHPSDPDWHICFIDGCNKQEGDHQHFPKKSLAGKGAKIVAFLCRNHHQKITLHQWREGVYTHPDGSVRYYVQNTKGEQQCERIIEEAPVLTEEIVAEVEGMVLKEAPNGAAGFPPFGLVLTEEPPPPDGPREARTTESSRPITRRGPTPPRPKRRETLPAVTVSKPAKEADVEYNEVGLRLADNLTREQWEGIMGTIQQMVVSVPWWVGDALVYGQRFGEEMWQAIKDKGGADYEKLRKYMWVAERVPIGTRVPALKWSHHREVADLEPDLQREWLQRAQDEKLGANALRVAIKGEEPETCPEGGEHDYERRCKKCGKT